MKAIVNSAMHQVYLERDVTDEEALATETPELHKRTELLGGAAR